MRAWLLVALLLAMVPTALLARGTYDDARAALERDAESRGSPAILVHLGTLGPRRGAATTETQRRSLEALIATRRIAAHEAAVRNNAAARARCRAHNERRRASFGPLYGDQPATPGPAFGGLRVDEAWVRPPEGSFPIHWELSGRGIYATVADGSEPFCAENDDPAVFCPFRCTDDEEADCNELRTRLQNAWGASDDDVWLDRAKRVRAAVRLGPHPGMSGSADCELRFQPYVPPRSWIAMNASAAVPLALVGRSSSKLPEAADAGYAPMYTDDPDVELFEWDIPITGAHIMAARAFAYVRDSRIVRLEIRGEIDTAGGADEIHELVRPFRGGGRSISLETSPTSFTLTVGR